MAQPKFDINVNQNATFRMSFSLTDASGSALDITNWTFTGSIKTQVSDPDPPYMFFTCSADASSSVVEVKLPATETERLTNPRYVYDLIGVDSTATVSGIPTVYRLLQGNVKVDFGVTDLDPSQ